MTQETIQNLVKQAELAYRAGKYSEAADFYRQAAHQERTSSGDGLKVAELGNNCSVALLQAGEAQAALDAAEGTDQVFAQAGDLRRQGLALGNQAAALEALNRSDEALTRYRQSADLLQQSGDTDNRAAVLKSISALQIRTGHHLEALASMDGALNNQKKLSLQERFLKKLINVPMKMLRR